jgi:TPR repeat protein
VKPLLVLALAVLLSQSAGAADAKEPKKVDLTRAFRACALVEKVDVLHGGTLTDEGRESAKSCLALGIAYEDGEAVDLDGRRIDANYKLALHYYEAACGAQIAFGCLSIGQLLEKGRATSTKGADVLSVASNWYALGCTLPNSDEVRLCCFLAGQATFKSAAAKTGKIRARKLASAMKFLQRACELGDDASCTVVIQAQEALTKQ